MQEALKYLSNDKIVPDKVTHITDASKLNANPLESIPINIPLPFPIYVKVADIFLLFRSAGDLLTQERIADLKEKGADTIYIPKDQWENFLKSLETQVLNLDSNPNKTETAHNLRKVMIAYEKDWETNCRILAGQVTKFEIWGAWLTSRMEENPRLGLQLLRHYDNAALYYVNHSFNVAIYAAYIGFHQRMAAKDVKELVLSALLHNVGNISIPPEILFKVETLEPHELGVIRAHTNKGAAILRAMGASETITTIATQHHERVDGQGYPNGLKNKEIHPFAKIISVADVYDALLSSRPHHMYVYNSLQAVGMMSEMTGKFDPSIFGFIKGAVK